MLALRLQLTAAKEKSLAGGTVGPSIRLIRVPLDRYFSSSLLLLEFLLAAFKIIFHFDFAKS